MVAPPLPWFALPLPFLHYLCICSSLTCFVFAMSLPYIAFALPRLSHALTLHRHAFAQAICLVDSA